MPKMPPPMSDEQIAALSKQGSYIVGGVNGLSLYIDKQGRRYWRVRYREDSANKSLTIGAYPAISPTEARALAMQVRQAAFDETMSHKADNLRPLPAAALDKPGIQQQWLIALDDVPIGSMTVTLDLLPEAAELNISADHVRHTLQTGTFGNWYEPGTLSLTCQTQAELALQP